MLCSINILLDYEDQTYQVKLIVDGIDFAFYWIFVVEMIFRVFVHMKYIPSFTFNKAFKLDLILLGLCSFGLVYEVITAENM